MAQVGDSIVESPETGCWIWQGCLNPAGYGNMRHEGRTKLTHRAFYEELVGPIPEGLTIDHLCRTPACVNPGHLEPVTMLENLLRGNGPVGVNARKTHCKRGHPFDEVNTYINKQGNRTCRACHRDKERVRHQRLRSAA